MVVGPVDVAPRRAVSKQDDTSRKGAILSSAIVNPPLITMMITMKLCNDPLLH